MNDSPAALSVKQTDSPAKLPISSLELVACHFESGLVLSRSLQAGRKLLYGALVIGLAILLWATWMRVDRIVRASGRIIPQGKPQLVQHLEGGIVSAVYVHEGDIVEKGQPLVAVSDTMANSARGEKLARRAGLLAKVARLEAEAAGKECA